MRTEAQLVGLAVLYTACDELVYPCRATDFPIAALEAMACACPAIFAVSDARCWMLDAR
ncbi:MAG: hypothetical protein QF473_00260 [Planctomycetota bacterium]|nr:hypothetical protein [Planctomycetota bacterium]